MNTALQNNVLIIGGGPAGLATALALRAAGIGVTILERTDYSGVRVGEHLGAEASALLDTLGIDAAEYRAYARPCPGVLAQWGSDEAYLNHALLNPFGEGFILARPDFDRMLARAALRRGAALLQSESLHSLHRSGEQWQAVTKRGTSIRADFIVDAGGRPAVLARLLHIERIHYDNLTGVTAFCAVRTTQRSKEHFMHIIACPAGWWYHVELPDGRASLSFMSDATELSRHKLTAPEYLLERIGECPAIAELLRAHAAPGRVHVRSARSSRMACTGGAGWLAVGDAAIAYDPLSSAGIKKGLEWGMRAAQCISEYSEGDTQAIHRYDTAVQAAYDGYLRERAMYYRREQRWPDSPFWQRRHSPLAEEQAITLNPYARVRRSRADAGNAHAAIRDALPAVDVALLLDCAENTARACDIAARYKEQRPADFRDRDIVVAIQMLLQEGSLREGA